MIKILKQENMGKSEMGWLHSTFHFSFAEYYNPENIRYGALRVVNDDLFDPHGGFDTHPHQNMEIVSYVVNGTLTHKDSMGNERVLTRGQVQYMSAGTGVTHSEFNRTDNPLRFLQIWILPDKTGYKPNYGDYAFDWQARENKWLRIVSSDSSAAPIQLHQDMNISVISMDAGTQAHYAAKSGRQLYLIQIEGSGTVNGQPLREKDAAALRDEDMVLQAETKAHYIVFDMQAE